MVVVLMTLAVNYSLAIGCGDPCFSESDSPVDFPDHMFISSTLQKAPTCYTGIAGFSMAAITGVMMGLLRYFQIKHIAAGLEPEELKENIMRKNDASLKYLFVFGVSLVILSIFPPDDAALLQSIVHYCCSCFTFVCFLVFVVLQLNRIEGTLISLPPRVRSNDIEIPLLHSDAQCPYECLQSYNLKKKWLSVLIVLGSSFLLSMQAWTYLNKPRPLFVAVALFSETSEVLTVILGSIFIGLTDFTVAEKQYAHLRPNPVPEPLPQS